MWFSLGEAYQRLFCQISLSYWFQRGWRSVQENWYRRWWTWWSWWKWQLAIQGCKFQWQQYLAKRHKNAACDFYPSFLTSLHLATRNINQWNIFKIKTEILSFRQMVFCYHSLFRLFYLSTSTAQRLEIYRVKAGNALGIWICGCRCILESSGSQNSGCT